MPIRLRANRDGTRHRWWSLGSTNSELSRSRLRMGTVEAWKQRISQRPRKQKARRLSAPVKS